MDYLIRKHSQLLSSPLSVAIRAADDISDAYARDNVSMSLTLMHFHGGDSPEIAFNDVEAIQLSNTFTREGRIPLKVPAYPTAAYNVHHHTSEYDGGVVSTGGAHSHIDNKSGGFCFSIFAPSVGGGVPMADWE
jgi:hypothetical protein